jgi:ribosome-associated toxin RatA of RatAB toxin-antitoxin module
MFNRLKTIAGICLIASVLTTTMLHAAEQEKLSLNKNGIKVWTYQVTNNPMMQYRAETIFNTTLENAAGLVLDTERGKKWIPYVSELKVIEHSNQSDKFIIYMRLDLPFPLSDRDLVVEGKLSKIGNDKIIFKNKSITDARVPVKSNAVRINHYEGDWIFQRLNAQQVKVTTSGFADPSGSIPISFVNSFVQQQPYQMLQKMKLQLKNSNYTQKDLPEALH